MSGMLSPVLSCHILRYWRLPRLLLVVITKESMPPLWKVILGRLLMSLSSASPVTMNWTWDLQVASPWEPVSTDTACHTSGRQILFIIYNIFSDQCDENISYSITISHSWMRDKIPNIS